MCLTVQYSIFFTLYFFKLKHEISNYAVTFFAVTEKKQNMTAQLYILCSSLINSILEVINTTFPFFNLQHIVQQNQAVSAHPPTDMMPPSTVTLSPVMKLAPSPARKSTTFATSAISPIRPIGYAAPAFRRASDR